jgi:hypothetical protein
MALSAVFPAGSRVCMTRSGDAARGFYAWYGTHAAGCPERGDVAATRMSVDSSFNALDQRTPEEAAGTCRPVPLSLTGKSGGLRLAFRGASSLACMSALPGGWLEISVNALAGRRSSASPRDAPIVLYTASLTTRPDRLGEDLPMFRAFLAQLQIGLDSSDPAPAQ